MSSSTQYSPDDLSRMARRVQGIGESIFSEMTRLAIEHNAVNLSQGFPDFPTPEWLKEAGQDAIARNINQYAPSHGSPRLRKAIVLPLFHQRCLAKDRHRLQDKQCQGASLRRELVQTYPSPAHD